LTAPSMGEIAEEVRAFGSEERELLRATAQKDLYVFSKGILGYPDVIPEVHGPLCKRLVESPKRRRLWLLPRGHLKSTVATVADSLRLGIDNPDDARILIVGETATLGEKFLSEIKNHCMNNEVLRSLWPELIPERFTGPGVQWSSTMASLRRSSAHKEPTWQAIGVGGASVGSHFTRIKADDLIGFEAARSAADMAYVIAWVSNIEPLLVNQHRDIIDFIGTRWLRNDVYSFVMEAYGEALEVYTRQAIEDGKIIFPNLHTWEEYSRIQRINPLQWAAQYNNAPIAAGHGDFPVGNILNFMLTHDNDEVVASDRRYEVAQLDRVLAADPNSGSLVAPDAAAISVQGYGPRNEVFVLDSWSGRVSPSDFVDKIYALARKWRVRVVGIEKAGQQNTEHYFRLKAEAEQYSVRVQELKPRGRAKEDRVRAAVEPLIRSQLLYLLPSQTILRQQLGEFPDTLLWDEVDALAYGPELGRKPPDTEKIERRQGALKRLLTLRSHLTGY